MSGPKTLAYLLRGWEERPDDEGIAEAEWRFSLEDPHSGRLRGFASLAEMTAALLRKIEEEENEG